LAGQAADLHERPAQEVGELGGRVRGSHQRGSDEDGVGACKLGCGGVGAVLDATLRDDHSIAWGARDKVQLGAPVDLEGGEVARVQADDFGA
jgi:hypothetical protein